MRALRGEISCRGGFLEAKINQKYEADKSYLAGGIWMSVMRIMRIMRRFLEGIKKWAGWNKEEKRKLINPAQ